jgi:hypothetical protein
MLKPSLANYRVNDYPFLVVDMAMSMCLGLAGDAVCRVF